MNNVGIKIKTARKAKGLKRKELAELVNLSLSSIQHIENDNRMPSLEFLYHISRALDRPLDYFVEDEYIVEHDELHQMRDALSQEERAQLIEIELQYCRCKSQKERVTAILGVLMENGNK